LIAGAILVPFSWYICAIIIDIGNILGQGIVSLMSQAIPPPDIDLTSISSKFFLGTATTVATFVLAGAAATVGFGAVLSLLIAFVGVFLTLIFRKIFIILLVILSPFICLAWVLPNTEKWARRGANDLIRLVLMYPLIMLLFEIGRLFASAAGATTGTGTDFVKPLFEIFGLILPLFAVPFAFKLAGTGLAAGVGGINRLTGAADKRFGKDSDRAKDAAANRERNNLYKGRRLGDAAKALDDPIKNATGAQKAALKLQQKGLRTRSNARYARAGIPVRGKMATKLLGANESADLRREQAYAKAMGEKGITEANLRNSKEGLPSEDAGDRLAAET
ncbi:MAG TPA: hypothetical protein VMT30_08855, partial [Candidatus Saccharimonadia bacterium]|nr:hypothetical protein [Candidatus Saccharimonadia bacterium]